MPTVEFEASTPEEEKPKSKFGLPVALMVIAVVIVGGGFLVLFLLSRNLTTQQTSLNNNLKTLNIEQESLQPVEEKAKVLQAQLNSLQDILDNHLCWSDIFSDLEGMTIKKAFFKSLTGESSNRTLVLSAQTETYATLAEQLTVFDDSPLVDSYTISGATLTTEDSQSALQFDVTLTLTENAFLCQPPAAAETTNGENAPANNLPAQPANTGNNNTNNPNQ